jgi:hypothetical protein
MRIRANEVCALIRENSCNSWLIVADHAAGAIRIRLATKAESHEETIFDSARFVSWLLRGKAKSASILNPAAIVSL